MKILEDSEMMKCRPIKLTIDDFLKLLCVFNENGVHFCWKIKEINNLFCIFVYNFYKF